MTCIVGLVEAGRIYLGGDSAATNGWDLSVLSSPKVFKNGAMVLGGTGTLRSVQLLQYGLVVPAHPEGVSVERYLVTTFVDAVRECLKTTGHAEKDKESERYPGGFLVGYRGRLASIDTAYAVQFTQTPYQAAGCGESFALGVLYATEGMAPVQRVTLALEAAERFSAGVRAPFHVEVLEALETPLHTATPAPLEPLEELALNLLTPVAVEHVA